MEEAEKRLSGIRAVFLDVDNTLLDFEGYVKESMRVGFRRFGIGTYREEMFPIFQHINNGLWRQIEKGEMTFAELQEVRWNRIFRELGLEYDGPTFETFFREFLFTSAIPMEGALELLQVLRSRGTYRLYIASNGPHEQQLNRLRIAGMLELLDDVFTSERMGASKPAGDFFRNCFREIGKELPEGERPILPEETVMIGDSLTSDMDGALNWGMKTCLYTRGRENVDPGSRKIDCMCKSLWEICEML